MLLFGKPVAAKLLDEAQKMLRPEIIPSLAVILVGHDPASEIYVAKKMERATELGVRTEVLRPENPTTTDLIAVVQELNARPDIQAILVQLPLPSGIDTDAVIAAMDPQKDVDGFHPENVRAFLADSATHTPVLLLAVRELLQATQQNFSGKQALVIGNSPIFLAPLTHQLEILGMTATAITAAEPNLSEKTLAADVLIVAVGQPNFITADMIKADATIIDIGFNRLPDGRSTGDVQLTADLQNKTAFVTPTPGGVGPVTVAALIYNTVFLASRN